MKFTKLEKEVFYLTEIDHLTLTEVADKINYSLRQVQRIKKSANRKVIEHFVCDEFEKNICVIKNIP